MNARSDRIIVTPAELGTIGINAIQKLHNDRDRLMPVMLPGLDGYFAPLEPGSLTVVLAQTHNGKSWFMKRWMARMIKFLTQQGRTEDEAIVWVDTETPADYLGLSQISRLAGVRYGDIIASHASLDMGALMQAALQVARMPVYTIATRLGRDGSEVHLSNIRKGIDLLTKGQIGGKPLKIAAIFVDYLQALPIDPVVRKQPDISGQRRLQVSRDVDLCRVMGSQYDCPIILGVQARQDMTPSEAQKALALPGIYDGQETANIGQRADRILSLSVAARNFGRGETREYHGGLFTVRDNLMFVRVVKQRGDDFPAGNVFAYELDSAATDPYLSMVNVWSE